MALGQNYDNNQEREIYRPTVYGYSMSNTESQIDVTNLSFAMWKGTLKMAIAPQIKSSKDENPSWDREAAATIYLNHTKARIFAEILKGFLRSPKEFNNRGVWAGQGLLTISNGQEFGKDSACLVLRKIGETGQVESSYAYEFKKDYHCAIVNFVEKSGAFERDYDSYTTLEILQIITMLENYYNAMTNAVAFSVMDNMAFGQHRLNESLSKNASGVGVELYQQKSAKNNTSYFANSNRGTNKATNSSTIEEIFGDED